MMGGEVISNEVCEIRFGFYSEEEIRSLSICSIESPVTFDTLGNALSGGLYDELMGPQYQYSPNCKTCGDSYMHCPGHPGRIELCVPLYHPLLFKSLVFLLRAKCANCSKLRLSEFRTRVYLVKMKLIEMGHGDAVEALDAMLVPSAIFQTSEADIERELASYECQYDLYLAGHPDRAVSMHTTNKLNELIEQFKKAASSQKRCENCKAYSPALRKDGFTKIFEKPLSKKLMKTMENSKIVSALELMPAASGTPRHRPADPADSDDGNSPSPNNSSDDSSSESGDDAAQEKKKADKLVENEVLVDKYLTPLEVEARVKLLWASQRDVLDFIYLRALQRRKQLQGPTNIMPSSVRGMSSGCGEGWKLFFLTVLLVPPNRFRPPADMGDMKVEHPQNLSLNKVLVHNERIQTLKRLSPDDAETPQAMGIDLSKIVSTWIELQNAVNCYMDSAKDPNPLGNSAAPPGIRQLMERKEGLFRKNMMGKRVNFCCRSVLSPDPFIGSNEIGIPVQFAKELHYPTPVTDFNIKLMRQLVENGPHNYPGANAIEYPNGRVVSLDRSTQQQRDGHAKLLLQTPGMKVHRHLVDGDPLLVNRQPTLHKPGIMAHRARVLRHVKEQTIRMHYANCSSYNADFDGDEINCHFVQSELARAEANMVCNNDNQYIVPTSGTPLRGLIQDHIASGVKLTCRDTFLTREEFQQLLYVAVSGLPGTELAPPSTQLDIPPPAILRPVARWTGKQVVSALINHMCRPPLPALHLDAKARTPPHAYGASSQEHIVVFRYGELLCGVLDKAAVGSSSMGIFHAVHELYGPDLTGRLLTAFGRVFTYFLQAFSGISCGISDLTLRPEVDVERTHLLNKVTTESRLGLLSFLRQHESGKDEAQPDAVKANDITLEEEQESKRLLGHMLLSDPKGSKVRLDAAMQGVVNKAAGDVIKACLPNGLESPFSHNNFSLIVASGAKGSTVNQSQISCFLGQQALEGQRVPLMISGKSLPSFGAYDGTARAGGFISDRFLTGVKPQEYYFHCMAGREGLIDTAVKTSRSGYLQRCLVKHLEELKVNYDSTVRDSDGNVIQFIYGEDGLDPTGASMLSGSSDQMHFLARNYQALTYKYGMHSEFLNQGLDTELAADYWKKLGRAEKLAPFVHQGTGISVIQRSGKKNKEIASNFSSFAAALSKKSVVLARRKITESLGWSRNNMRRRWEVAEVVKVRTSEDIKDKNKGTTYDLRYSDGRVEKKVPLHLKLRRLDQRAITSQTNKDSVAEEQILTKIEPLTGSAEVSIPLIRAGLPDPATAVLPLDRSLGAMSEKMHKAILDYSSNVNGPVGGVVTPEALELLVGVKYMRALACPGEAVGCVAAQSIGEPSTQMTLNTFHLAGHGAANVTLGIPRMREIIMTASKTLKTPTMLLPLVKSNSMVDAKALARKMSKLSLRELVHHRRGIEVGESLSRGDGSGMVSRQYRIKLHFESPVAIEKHFGITFEQIVASVSSQLTMELKRLISAELRKNGEKRMGNAIGKYQERITNKAALGSDDEGENNNDIPSSPKSGKKGSARDVEAFGVDDASDEDVEPSDDDASESGYGKTGGSGGDAVEYEEEESEPESAPNKKVAIAVDSDSEESVDMRTKKAASLSKPKMLTPSGKKTLASVIGSGDNGITFSAHHAFVQVELNYPASMRRLLMLRLVEDAADRTAVRLTKGINRAHAVPCADENGVADAGVGIMTEGVNFSAAWSLSEELCRHSDIHSNDINALLMTYGVEAARESIVSEIKGVFGVYGINVNFRHLGLIADFMTRSGGYTPMNRAGMWNCPSPLQQMSFETTCTFLTQAAQDGTSDNLESPSARIVAGCTPRVGTGCFDIMVPLRVSEE